MGFDEASQTSLRAEISAAPGVNIVELDARFAFASLDPNALYGIAQVLPGAPVFSLPDASGSLTMTIGARDSLGRELTAMASTDVIAHQQAVVTIVIGDASCAVACAGSCPACGVGGSCAMDGDCVTGNCVANTCEPVSGPPFWQPVHDMPIGRIGAGAALGSDGLMYVYGGDANDNDTSLPTDEVDAYDVQTDTWNAEPGLLQAAFRFGYTSDADGVVYAFGGRTMDNDLATVQSLAPGAASWLEHPALPAVRHDMVAARDAQGTFYLIGGTDNTGLLGDVDAFVGGTWVARTPLQTPRTNLGVATFPDGTILAIGGHDDGGVIHFASVEAYDPIHDVWQPAPALNEARSDLGAALAPDGRVYAVAGYTQSGGLSSVEALRPGSTAWLEVAPTSAPRDACAVALGADGRIFVFGGKLDGYTGLTSAEAYGPSLEIASGTVTGRSFGANANARIYIDNVPVELVTTDANGGFTATVHATSGSHVMRAIDDRSQYPVTRAF